MQFTITPKLDELINDMINAIKFLIKLEQQMFSKPNQSSQYHYTFNPKYQIGTPFEDPDEKKNFLSQKARDPSGNVRWKGAFTGGFEAGYKNTCGSKQGWTPSSFVSSRTNRFEDQQEAHKQILDYMDEQDLGGLDIASNIQVKAQFRHESENKKRTEHNNIYGSVLAKMNHCQTIGSKILKKMKQKQAQESTPEDLDDLKKLLENYSNNEEILDEANALKQTTFMNSLHTHGRSNSYFSVGCLTQPQQDDFITIYSELFNKVIRKSTLSYNDDQNEEKDREEKQKQQKNNRIFFDFTKPLEEEPQYLKELRDLDEFQRQQARGKPRKRVKNIVNQSGLQNLFIMKNIDLSSEHQNKESSFAQYALSIPDEYDPYHRVKSAQNKQKQFVISADQNSAKSKHRIFTVSQRSDVLGENNKSKLSDKFVKPGEVNHFSNKFVRAGQDKVFDQNKDIGKTNEKLEVIFKDENKNRRFWDYVLELEGKKISAQLQNLDFESAQKQRKEFQEKYEEMKKKEKTKKQQISSANLRNTRLPQGVQEALKGKSHTVVRKSGVWKPQKVLCKRFGCFFGFDDSEKGPTREKRNEPNNYF